MSLHARDSRVYSGSKPAIASVTDCNAVDPGRPIHSDLSGMTHRVAP
jgi:hypothetical protein